ncbi:MAG: AAA family ATPase, partial [Longicatena sp.]
FRVILMNLNSTPQDTPQDVLIIKILDFCKTEKSAGEIMSFCELKDKNNFRKVVLNPLLEQGLLLRTIPDKPTSKFQKYLSKQ